MIVEGPESATVHDHTRFIDDVNALRPSTVGEVGSLLHVIYANRQRKVEALDEIVGDGYALGQRLRLRVTNALVHVAFHLPFVLRMGFAYIDGQKVRLSFVIVVKIYEVAYLATEGRSGITSENENQRTLPDTVAQMKCGLPIEIHESDVGRAISHAQIAAMPLRQCVAKESVNVAWPAHEMAEGAVAHREDGNDYEDCPLPPTQRTPLLFIICAAYKISGLSTCG
jgi:hypothetical protein